VTPPLVGGDDLAMNFPPQFTDRVQVTVFDLRLLARLAVAGRPTSTAESTSGLRGPLVYNDLSPEAQAYIDERVYAATRSDIQLVLRLVDRYNGIFGEPDADRTPEIADDLARAARQWTTLQRAAEVDPAAFRDWVQSSPDHAALARRIGQIESLCADLKKLGLSEPEFRQAKLRLLKPLATDPAMTVDRLMQVMERARGS